MLNLGLLEQNRKPDQQMDAGGASRGQNTGGALSRVLLELVCVPRAGAGAGWSRLVGAEGAALRPSPRAGAAHAPVYPPV